MWRIPYLLHGCCLLSPSAVQEVCGLSETRERAREREWERDMLCKHSACVFEGVCSAMGNLLLYCLQNNSSDSIDFL